MNSIVIILPYFGSFRNDFALWLSSVAYNKTIDFLLFTDQVVDNAPENLKVIPFTLHQVEKLAQEKIDSVITITSPYKLCDFKPAYGHLFEDYIKEYDFWGHCDCDLVFGDLRHFITDEVLSNHDRILERGHLTLYRNEPQVNLAYQAVKKPHYKEVFYSLCSFCFDEWGGTTGYWHENLSDKLYKEIIFDDILLTHLEFVSAQKANNTDRGVGRVIFCFDKGKLYRYYIKQGEVIKEETAYAHFQKRTIEFCAQSKDRFIIVPNRAIDWKEDIDSAYLQLVTPSMLRSRVFYYYMKAKRVIAKIKKYL